MNELEYKEKLLTIRKKFQEQNENATSGAFFILGILIITTSVFGFVVGILFFT